MMKASIPIDLSPEAVAQLKVTIHQSPIDEKTQGLLLGLVDFCLWLQFKLQESKISISRLKSLFGVPKKISSTTLAEGNNSNPDKSTDDASHFLKKPNDRKKPKGHGRKSANAYTHASVQKVTHPQYLPGDPCPTLCGGKLYLTRAGQFIRIQGGSLVEATRYEIEKLRC